MLGNISSALWLLAMLAAAAHLRDARRGVGSALPAAAAFGAVLALSLGLLPPQPNAVGVLLGGAAAWRLLARPWPRAGAAWAGACAALAAGLLVAGGQAPWLAIALTAVALLAVLGWRPVAPSAGRPQAVLLLLVALAAPLLGLSPDLLYGWHSALALSQAAAPVAALSPPAWSLLILALALVAGLIRGMWTVR